MSPGRVSDEKFRAAVERLRVPEMGTEAVASLLAAVIKLVRPRRVLEVGMGYTTPFLAAGLAEVEEQVRVESLALAGKTRPYLADGTKLDDTQLNAEPALVAPAFYVEPYRPTFVAVDDLSIEESSAGRVQEVLRELHLEAQLDDTIVLAFNLRDNTVDMGRIPADADARQRLRVLLGKSVRNPVAALARALRCSPEDIAALLRRRGDKELLALLNESAP